MNNGVYRYGVAKTQKAYAVAYHTLFESLGWLADHPENRRFCVLTDKPRQIGGCIQNYKGLIVSIMANLNATRSGSGIDLVFGII